LTAVSRLERQPKLAPSIYAEEVYGLALTAGSDRRWSVFADTRNLWQVPIVASPILHGGFEASSPYGYPGIYADRSLSAEQVTEHWERTVQLLRADGVISLFLRFPPFEYPGLGIEAFFGLNHLELELMSKTIEVATSEPDKVWSGMSGRARTAVRKALKVRMTAEVCPASQANLGPNSAFRTLYESTMKRIGASTHHVYGDSYYSTLLSGLSDRVFVVNVTTFEGKPAASAMVLLDGDVVHYHLSGSDPQEARSGANNLLLWTILEWSARQNFQSVHLGGGLSADDNLFRFKESFGGASRDFWVGRAVIDQDRYTELATRHAESLGVTVAKLESSGFFPTFRAEP
jgi:hypothetical protein